MSPRTRIPLSVTFLPGLAAAAAAWVWLREPYHLEGLGFLAAAALVCWPLLAVAAVASIPALTLGEWLRAWRRWAGRWETWPLLALTMAVVLPCGLLLTGLWPRAWRKSWRGFWGRDGARSSQIPVWFRHVIYAADRWRCWYCGGPAEAVDHGCAWSLGGCTTLANCWALCTTCNLAKSNATLFRGRFWPGRSADPVLAEAILRALRWHRVNPVRWLRAARALAG